jgi:hypothetical protein
VETHISLTVLKLPNMVRWCSEYVIACCLHDVPSEHS